MNSFLFAFSALAFLAMTKGLPCIGDSCGRLSAFFSEYDDDDGVFYIREGSHNSALSKDDENNDDNPEQVDNFRLPPESLFGQQYQKPHPNRQRLSHNHQQRVGPNTPDQGPYQSNQQNSNSITPLDDHQETQFTPKTDRRHQGNYNSFKKGGNGGYYENNDGGFNQRYPDSGHQGGNNYQKNGARNEGRYASRQSKYASDFGNGEYNKNIINIEK